MLIDEPLPEGYYKVRSRKAGPWIPIHIWLEDGERCPETWELLSDQQWKAEWAPRTDSPKLFSVNPFQFINRARRITKDEYEWLLILKTIPSPRRSPKRSSKSCAPSGR